MSAQKDARIVGMVKEAHRLSHIAINTIHRNGLPEAHEIHGLANALIAGGHVSTGSGTGRPVDHAGANADNDNMLDSAYEVPGEKSGR